MKRFKKPETKNGADLERIEVAFEIKALHEEDDNFFRFEGLASTFGNLDLVDDIVLPGAFKESIAAKMPVILWQHDQHTPIGMPEEIRETDEGLFIRVRLPKDDDFVRGRVIPQIKVGSIQAMSIGFQLQEFQIDEERIRTLEKVDLKEVSLVTFPANPLAKVTDFKTVTPFANLPVAATSRVWSASEAIARVRTKTGSTEKPSASYRRAFLWFDAENAEDFGSYKLPFADVIEGTLTAIPRAINNAKARLDQTDIPASDKPKVLTNIEKYQDKFEKSSDDDEKPKFDIDAVREIKTRREFETCLRESGAFTKNAAVLMAKFFQGELVKDEPTNEEKAAKVLSDLSSKFESVQLNNSLSSILNKLEN